MESLNYLEVLKRKYNLTDLDLIDIVENIGYIARDNGLDDSVCDEIIEVLEYGE